MRGSRFIVFALALGATMLPGAFADARSFDVGHVHVTTTDVPKRFDMAVTVPATVDQVWDAFTTPAGLTTWLAPFAQVELAVGGPWHVSVTPDGATAGGTVLLYQPKSLLALSAMAPTQFPTVRRQRTTAVFLFDAAGPNATTVRLAQTGLEARRRVGQGVRLPCHRQRAAARSALPPLRSRPGGLEVDP